MEAAPAWAALATPSAILTFLIRISRFRISMLGRPDTIFRRHGDWVITCAVARISES